MSKGVPMSSRGLVAAALIAACVALAAAPGAARAGEYAVYACTPAYGNVNQSWTVSVLSYPFAAYACSQGTSWDRGLVTRLDSRSGLVRQFDAATYTFHAPPGTTLTHIQYDRAFCAGSGYLVGITKPGSGPWDLAGNSCAGPTAGHDLALPGATEVSLTTECAQNFCDTSYTAHAALNNVRVFVNDSTPPSVALTGGTIKTSAWQRGTRSASVGASDSAGIGGVSASIDGAEITRLDAICDYTRI